MIIIYYNPFITGGAPPCGTQKCPSPCHSASQRGTPRVLHTGRFPEASRELGISLDETVGIPWEKGGNTPRNPIKIDY